MKERERERETSLRDSTDGIEVSAKRKDRKDKRGGRG